MSSSRRARAAALTLALVATSPSALGAQGSGIVVRRTATDSVRLAPADLAKLTRDDLQASEHGKPATFSGVSFVAALAAAGVRLDSLHGPRLADVLLVEATDGYRVTFTLAELAPDLGGRAVLLADRRDGAALGADEGPFRLVVPADGRPTRWIRQVRAVSVVRVTPP